MWRSELNDAVVRELAVEPGEHVVDLGAGASFVPRAPTRPPRHGSRAGMTWAASQVFQRPNVLTRRQVSADELVSGLAADPEDSAQRSHVVNALLPLEDELDPLLEH
jgi:hypothetical protein